MSATSKTAPGKLDAKAAGAKLAEDIRNLELSPETKEAMVRYMPYLIEAQKKLLFTLIAFIATTITATICYKPIMMFVMQRFNLAGINMVFTSPLQFFDVALKIGIYCGLIVGIPLFIWNLVSFFKPALKEDEYKLIVGMVPISIGLFILGFIFGAWVEKFVIDMFSGATAGTDIMNIWDVSKFFSDIIIMGFLMGAIFQFPIILTILLKLKVLKRAQLVKYRLYVYVASLFLAILMPPQDLLSNLILCLPLVFFFEITLLLNKD